MGTIYIEKTIKRNRKNGGIIRIDTEACDILEGIINRLNSNISICKLASTLIKNAAENNVIEEKRTTQLGFFEDKEIFIDKNGVIHDREENCKL